MNNLYDSFEVIELPQNNEDLEKFSYEINEWIICYCLGLQYWQHRITGEVLYIDPQEWEEISNYFGE